MEENFDPVARTRANYYTPGSPVQFVCVELLKGEASGDHAVCLTFKNISRVTLTALEIHFKCKGVDVVILCEDQFEYRDIEVKPGETVAFVGPSGELIDRMGDKDAARRLMKASGVPIIPGSGILENADEAKKAAKEIARKRAQLSRN
mgnify:CR=1 FL=1